MTINGKSIRTSISPSWSRVIIVSFVVMTFLAPISAFGQLNLWDAPQGLPDLDNRAGQVTPTAQQMGLVDSMGARAEWNQFGTVHTMLKYGGFLATGLSGDPVSAAREWVRANRVLFRLSDQNVTDLELVSDGVTPYSTAHAVLFRQRFGSLFPTQDGLINVAIVNGNVYHVWSSSAGDQPAPAAATLTPTQAWLDAAASVNHIVPVANVLSAIVDKQNNWTVLKVAGFPQEQRVRLTALPTPTNGVRPAYEANVVYVQGHIADAYTVFVDARTGEVLYRANRVNWAAPAPETTVFTGTYMDAPAPAACGPKHSFLVGTGKLRIVVVASAAIPSNDIVLKLYFFNGVTDVLLVSGDTATSPETVTYEPPGGVPPGTYKVEICPFTPPTAPAEPPYNYAGTFTTDDSAIPGAGVPYPPKWKYFQANPLLTYASTDVRLTGCWEASLGGVPVPGCDHSLLNLAARAPWDYEYRSNTFTSTTRGNAAQTAESWGSPLTPSTPYAPVSATREYIFPWANDWKTSGATGKGCDPTILVHTGGARADADIDAAIGQLFVTHNRMHDWSYFLGFTEQNSNLQLDNLGNTQASRENDPEIGNVQAGAVSGGANGMYLGRDNANQITLQDGVPGITNQYLFQPIAAALYSPCVDGDMDVGIVGHEYTHAISNRMVGGPDAGISGAQGGSMGESWSDLDAAEYLFANGFVPTSDEDPTAVGIYATQNKKVAIRDYSLAVNPLNYSNIGFDTPGPEVHADGEIWNGTNWDVRQALIDKYNAQYPYTDMVLQKACAEGKKDPANCPGNRRWIQLMFDAFLLQPGATSMLDARDAMLAADTARFGGANQLEIWRAFAKRGMGVDAITNGTGDTAPIPNFDSAAETNEAAITFQAVAQDEGNATITNAKIIVGQFQTRSRAIADTDPATGVADTAKFVPGAYDLIVQAPGYGIQRFTRTFLANQTATVVFPMPTNVASLTKGATITTTATEAADIAARNNLIDDTEDTGARIGTVAPVAGKSLTVDLAGNSPVMVSSVNVSTSAGPSNSGRFTGVRKFEIRTCNGTCTDPVADFTNVAFTSADDAFPGDVPRPLQPNLNLRSFAITPTLATHVQLRVVTTQCTGQAKFAGDQDDDPFNNSDCPSSASGPIVRATEFEVFGPVVAAADLFVDKNGPDTVKRGETFDYTIEVKNNGPSMANGVTLTDFLPKNAGFGSASSTQGTCSFKPAKRIVTCDLGNIASGATVTVTITVKATDQKPIINKASVEAASPADPNLNNNTDTKTTNVGP
jgi:extracellular elastinolytic metalloproteinase